MSDLDHARRILPPVPTPTGWFEPTPQQLSEQIPAVRERFGEESIEYVALLAQLGDAHMVQGSLAHPQAQTSYEEALQILQRRDDAAPEIAWLHDKLANVKKSSGDSFGAQADLEKAVGFWKENPPVNAFEPEVRKDHVARREEDLRDLVRLNVFLKRKPPEN